MFRGKSHKKRAGLTKKQAEIALSKRQVEIFERKHGIEMAPSTPWKDAVKKYLEWVRTNREPGTYNMYYHCSMHLTKHFGYLHLDEITSADIEQYKTKRLSEKVTPKKRKEIPGNRRKPQKERSVSTATINRELSTLSALQYWAAEQKPPLLLASKIVKAEKLKESEGRMRVLTGQEITNLLSKCETTHLRMAVIIALETGLRIHGCLTLRWKEDFIADHIRKKVKRGTIVNIPVTEGFRKELEKYRVQSKILSRYVIPSPKDPSKHMVTTSDFGFSKACRDAGIEDFHFHDLRHTFATHFLQRTKDLRTLQIILGHKSIKTTEKYVHLVDDHIRQQMEEYDKGGIGGTHEAQED